MPYDPSKVDDVLYAVTQRYRGPGGAIALLKDGELVGQRAWGYADLDERVPMTTHTLMPICSITKQMVCTLLVDLQRNPPAMAEPQDSIDKRLSDGLQEVLSGELSGNPGLTIERLCNMQSGLRDYWACCILWGAKPESRFSIADDSGPMLERMKSFHFQPGTEFSYSNTNYHALARVIERLSEASLGKLLAERVFKPAGMTTAKLSPDTAHLPSPCVGYEGDERRGYVPALNRIEWDGDAGAIASLDDMVAYERHIDRSASDAQSLYHEIAKPRTFEDGTPASVHYGLVEASIDGLETIGHGGALRGYRLQRLYAASERLSVVIMFNHEANAKEAADFIVRKMMDMPDPSHTIVEPSEGWIGYFLDEGTQLVAAVSAGDPGHIVINFAGGPEVIRLTDATHGRSGAMTATLDGDVLRIDRLKDHLTITATRLSNQATYPFDTVQGDYKCAELDSVFHCYYQGGVVYGAFDGFMGKGPMYLMQCVGPDVWLLACPRGPDAPAPGDWTVVIRRDEEGKVVGATVGCWLARRVEFSKSA